MSKWILSALLACAAGTVAAQTITLNPSGRCGAVPGYEEPLYELACRAGPVSGIYPGAIVKEATTPDGHVITATSDGVDWREPSGGSGGGSDIIIGSTLQYSTDTSSLVWEDPEGSPHSTGLYEGICADVLGTQSAGMVLHYREAGSGRKPICEWGPDDTASGGSGLDAAGVRTQTAAQLQAGDNISITPAGSGASQTLTIAAPDPYNDELIQARVRNLETFEGALRRTASLGPEFSLSSAVSNNAILIPNVSLPTAPRDQRLLFAIDGADPDDHVVVLSTLRGKTAINTPNTQMDDSNSIALSAINGVVYRIGHDGGTRLWIGADTIIVSKSVNVSVDEINIEAAAYKSATGSQFPTSRIAKGTASVGRIPVVNADGDAEWTAQSFTSTEKTKLDGIEDNATADQTDAEIKTAYENNSNTNAFTDAEQTKVGRLPTAACTNNQIAKWSGTAWTCGTDATGGGDGLSTSDVDNRIKPPARAGNTTNRFARTALPSDTLYHGPHVDSVLGAFLGTDASTNSTTIEVGGIFTAQPSLSTLRSVPDDVWVFSQEVGPRQTNAWVAIRAPSGQAAAITAGSRALDITESEIGVFERYPATEWVRIGTTDDQGTFVYYAVEVADFPSGAMYLVREQHELDLDGDLIDIVQWRRTLGLAGIHFQELYPGVSPNPTSSNQAAGSVALDTSPDTGTQAFDLDITGGTRSGELHIQLDLKITDAHTSVSFTSGRTTSQITAADKVRVFSTTIDVADLLEEPQFGVGRTTNGIYLWQVQAFAATTPQGTYRLLLYRNDDNEVGFYRDWVGAAGSSALTISAELRVSFTPDGPSPSLDDLGGLTQTEVDARVTAGTKPAARAGNTTTWTATEAPGRDANLSFTRNATTVTIQSDSGTNTQIPTAGGGNLAGVMSDAQADKLAAIEANATADQTAAEIKTAYESNSNTNAYTTVDQVKVGRLPTAACSNDQILKSDGTNFACDTDAAGATNLSQSRTASSLTVISSSGNNVVLPSATTSLAGVMPSADKVKVNRLPSAACTNGQIPKWSGSAWICSTDATASGGTGLDASGVRGETQAQLQAGTGISLTPSGSGATRQLTIASTVTAGASAYTDLSDTPGTLGTAGQVPVVNAAGTALEWSDRQGGTETMGRFTPSSTAANWGSVSNGSSPRTLTDPVLQTIGLAVDGTLGDGITLASNIITIRDAGRVRIDGEIIIDTNDTATNNNNSRSRAVCWFDSAPTGTTTWTIIPGSASTSAYIRVARPYWNHGAGYTYVHMHAEPTVTAGDQLRLRCTALFNQASTVQHLVAATNPDNATLLPGSSITIIHE